MNMDDSLKEAERLMEVSGKFLECHKEGVERYIPETNEDHQRCAEALGGHLPCIEQVGVRRGQSSLCDAAPHPVCHVCRWG